MSEREREREREREEGEKVEEAAIQKQNPMKTAINLQFQRHR